MWLSKPNEDTTDLRTDVVSTPRMPRGTYLLDGSQDVLSSIVHDTAASQKPGVRAQTVLTVEALPEWSHAVS